MHLIPFFSSHLRHFVAVDHANAKVVLSIRGTFSLSEMVVDVAGFSSKFLRQSIHASCTSLNHSTGQGGQDRDQRCGDRHTMTVSF